MKQNKRTLAALLVVISLLALCCSFAWAESNYKDNEPPVISNIKFDSSVRSFTIENASFQETITFSAKVIDDALDETSGVKSVVASVYATNSNGDTVYDRDLSMNYDGDLGRWKCDLVLKNDFATGTYNVAIIEAYDNRGNKATEPADLKFTITNKLETTEGNPKITSVSIDQSGNEVSFGDKIVDITVEAEITNATTKLYNKISSVTVDFIHEDKSLAVSTKLDEVSGGKWELSSDVEVTIDNFKNGKYTVVVTATDLYGKSVQNTSRSFTVLGNKKDVTAPIISNVALDINGKTVEFGGSYTLTATVEDASALESVVAYFEGSNEGLDYSLTLMENLSQPGTWCRVALLDVSSTAEGTYQLDKIVARDVWGNESTYTPTTSIWYTFADKIVPVEKITLDPNAFTLEISSTTPTPTKTISVVVYPTDASCKQLTWSSSASTIASVDQNGKVTGLKEGTAIITARSEDNAEIYATSAVTVTKVAVAVEKVTLDEQIVTLAMSNAVPSPKATLTATVLPTDASNKTVTYSSNNEKIATVDQNGTVTAVGVGTCTITCTSNSDSTKKATCVVTVTGGKVTSLKFSKKVITLKRTDETPKPTKKLKTLLKVQKTGTTTYKLKWTSSSKKVATVNANGVVKALSKGTTVITCQVVGGTVLATIRVRVK